MADDYYVHDLVFVPLFAVAGAPCVTLGRVVEVEPCTAIMFLVPFDAHLCQGQRVQVTVPDIWRLDWTDTTLTVWSPSFERSCTENLTASLVKARLKRVVERVLRRAMRERSRRISAQRAIAPWWLHAAYRPGGCMFRRLSERWARSPCRTSASPGEGRGGSCGGTP